MHKTNMSSICALIYIYGCDIIFLWGVTENDKRFAFRRSEYSLRTSSIYGGDTSGKYSERYKI